MEYLLAEVTSELIFIDASENIDEILEYSLDAERAIISTHQNSFSLISLPL